MNNLYWIIEFSSTFTETFLSTIFCGSFLQGTDFKKNFSARFFVSIAMAFIIILVNQINIYSPITVLFSYFLYGISNCILYHKSKWKPFVFAISFLLLVTLIDNVMVSSVSFLLELPIQEIYQRLSVYRVVAILSSKSILLIFVVVIHKLSSKKKTLQKKYVLALFAITTVMLGLTVALTFLDIYSKSVNSYASVLFFIMMLAMILILFFGAFRLADSYENQQQLQIMTMRNEMLEHSLKETEQTFLLWKTSIHDFKHIILYLETLADQNDIAGIREYLEQEEAVLGKTLFYYKSGNDTVDTILNLKQQLAENRGIPFLIHAEVPKNCRIASSDFAIILGNLIDNAMEASEKEPKPLIEIKIKAKGNFLLLVIQNNDTSSANAIATTKPDRIHHGIGLYSVQQTVQKYHGEFSIQREQNCFRVNIMLPIAAEFEET